MALHTAALVVSAGAGLVLTGCGGAEGDFPSISSTDVTTAAPSEEPTDITENPEGETTAIATTTARTIATTTTTSTTTSTTSTSATTTTAEHEGPQVYCPASKDLAIAYGDQVKLEDQGWTVQGDGGASTLASFNLAGGFVEFDLDVSQAKTGVIPNVYSIFPENIAATGFEHDSHYCDADEGAATWCVEHDWIESNGQCGGATALHSVPGTGLDGCNSWGCLTTYKYEGGSKFHMRIDYDKSGQFTVMRDGQVLNGYEPAPTADDFEILRSQHEQRGAVIYSSQWTGAWVPCEDCGTGPGDVAGSSFSVTNLRISGAVVQGPNPTRCPELVLDESTVVSV
jgi:hypothetical protein